MASAHDRKAPLGRWTHIDIAEHDSSAQTHASAQQPGHQNNYSTAYRVTDMGPHRAGRGVFKPSQAKRALVHCRDTLARCMCYVWHGMAWQGMDHQLCTILAQASHATPQHAAVPLPA
ncbi:hypothetical protein MN608_03928 [Microdochium nivale]|nr:hypothetical protein MN608_03928 [Microdochium nivale]